MAKLPTTLNDLNYNKVEVLRSELRNGKIIIVLKPSLLSDQIFAPNAFYDEGDKKNQLGSSYFSVDIKESGGVIEADAAFGNGLSHYTKGHSQIHCAMQNLFKTKIEVAVFEVLTTGKKYLFDSQRMKKIVDNVESTEEKNHVQSLIDGQIKEINSKIVGEKKAKMLDAIGAYERAIEEACAKAADNG